MAAGGGAVDLRIDVLGTFAVSVGGRPVALTARRLRATLATLAVSAGEPVSSDRLAAAVWGEVELPRDTRRAVQLYVARLRRTLGADVIRTVPNGYVLDVAPDQVDAVRFLRLLDAADHAADAAAERALLVEALALWSGDPVEGDSLTWLDGVAAQRLVDRRLATLERRIDLDLELGRTRDLEVELTALTARYPLREPFWAQLMTALYRTGQQAVALAAYQRLYRLFADELGIEPSAAVQELHRQILSGAAELDPPAPRERASQPLPRQLPADTSCFTGRAGNLAQLDALLPADDGVPTTVVISAIAGAAGVGKTALALHWARRVADRFPDGNLYVNLRGFDPSSPPVRPEDTIRGFLEALGISPRRMPADPAAQAGLYRTLLAGKRMLVLLDNARDADQVRPLLPGTPGCVAVATSRNQLTGLVAHDSAQLVNVDVLTEEEALRLLETRLGQTRVATEPRAAQEIVERCGRLPLALTVAAARAVAHPTFPLAALADELRDAQRRLDTLSGADSLTDLRAAFAVSYQTLTPDAARLFRLLGLHPGPDTSAAAAASLAGRSLSQARASLAQLAAIHLITEHEPGRYSFHDLLRAYAAELAGTQESGAERRAAIRRTLDHFLHSAHVAACQLNPHRYRPITPIDPAPGVAAERLIEDPLSWFTIEHPVLLACVRAAVDAGLDVHAWQLAWTLSGYIARRGRWQDWIATQQAALGAVERLGDLSAQAHVHRDLSRAYRQLGHLDEAHTHIREAMNLCAELDDRVGLGRVHLSLGQLYEMVDDLPAALTHAEHALRLLKDSADRIDEALALNAAGWCHARLGNHRKALTYCEAALNLQQQRDDRYGVATTWDSLGYIHHHLGDFHQAIACYESALAVRHDDGDQRAEAQTLIRLGDTKLTLADTSAAAQAWHRAVTMLDRLDHPDAKLARTKLQQLENLETASRAHVR